MERKYNIPKPIINNKENDELDILTQKYNKLIEPSSMAKLTKKAEELIPNKIKEWGKELGKNVSEKELYLQMMKLVEQGIKTIEEQASKYSISEKQIINRINKKSNYKINNLDEVCLMRSYELATLVNSYKTQDIFTAMTEGASTGALGFLGLPFNIVLSTFLFFRAIQSIAMFYGYDIKNDASELVIASDVFINALNPNESPVDNEKATIIGKIMIMTQIELAKQTSKKSWETMAIKGGLPLLLTQMRALAHKSAQKALEKTGQKGLENSLFKGTFEQIGKGLTKKSIGKMAIGLSAILGAFIDTAQMKKVLEYADIFYQKRFILEKEYRIEELLTNSESDCNNDKK